MKGIERRPGWLTRNVGVLAGVSFLQDAASELLYPILPIFLTVQLGAPPVVVGLVEGAAEGAASVTKLLAGYSSDRFSRRPLIALGYGAAAAGKVIIALAFSWPVVLIGRVVDRLGKGVRGAPRDALLMAGVGDDVRGRVFGFHRAADTAGAVLGPLLGLAGYELLRDRSDLRPLFVIAVIPALLSVLLVTAVRETPAAAASPSPAQAGSGVADARRGGRLPGTFWRTVGILTGFSLLNFPDSLLLLRVHDLGLGVVGVVLAYSLYNAVYALGSYPAGALSDRLAPPRVFALGLGFFAAGYLGLGFASGPAWVWVWLPLYGGFAACTDGVGKAWISSLAGVGRQGSAQGIYQGISGGAVLIAGIWAGASWGGDGRVPLLVSGFGAGIMAVYLAVRPPR